MRPPEHLRSLNEALGRLRLKGRTPGTSYLVPSAWTDPAGPPRTLSVDPIGYYHDAVSAILNAPASIPDPGVEAVDGGWTRSAVVYNMLVRLSTAWDHDGDGSLGLPLNREGWRETGTFLKSIVLLPYIRALGANTIHLLPVQEIGDDGRRGNLGSPYAVRDPRTIDPALAEPAVGLTAPDQFHAFIEAAHHLGLRVVLELPLRTQSKDSVWVKDHPEWFYWIRGDARFAPPIFGEEQVATAARLVGSGICEGLPVPAEGYRSMFTRAPAPGSLRREGPSWVGTLPDAGDVVIPGAFADWPPDDNQPVWGDVTYLKLFQDTAYNYVSYNTVRMYDSTILSGGTATKDLWEELADLVSWYAGHFGVDGMMVDMAHAIPDELTRMLVTRARRLNPDFAFWAEDFNRTVHQKEVGYDAVLGGQWACQHRRGDFRDMLAWLGRTPGLLPHLAAPETHNTPRAGARKGGDRYLRYAWSVSCFIPGIPFLHSGFELNETLPVNTGLGFDAAELELFPAKILPLFSARSLGWNAPAGTRRMVREAVALRRTFREHIVPKEASFDLVDGGDERVIAFVRKAPRGNASILVVANSDPEEPARFRISGPVASFSGNDLLSGRGFALTGGRPGGVLEPGEVALFAGIGEGGTGRVR